MSDKETMFSTMGAQIRQEINKQPVADIKSPVNSLNKEAIKQHSVNISVDETFKRFYELLIIRKATVVHEMKDIKPEQFPVYQARLIEIDWITTQIDFIRKTGQIYQTEEQQKEPNGG